MAADLKTIHRAATAETAGMALEEFRRKYPGHQVVADIWERNWQRITPFFEFPEEIRKTVYTTNAVESLQMSPRKVTKNRGSFPTQEAAIKLIYLAVKNVSKNWEFVQGWCAARPVYRIGLASSGHRCRGEGTAKRRRRVRALCDADDDSIWTAPSGAKVAWFKDPDGNVLSISQHHFRPRRRRKIRAECQDSRPRGSISLPNN